MTNRELISLCKSELVSWGIDSPDYEMRELAAAFLGIDRRTNAQELAAAADPEKEKALCSAVEKRKNGYPLQYILGSWSFMDITLSVGEGVLIPRDDTEVCVRECMTLLDRSGTENPNIIELCSGSGAIALALAKRYPGAEITALELSDTAFEYLCRNIEDNGMDGRVRPLKADILKSFADFEDGSFDVLISNPPYICSREIPQLQKEVLFEPGMALDGGDDGLVFYRCIAESWLSKLKSGGIVSLEIGEHQGQDVKDLLLSHGCDNAYIVRDIAELERTVAGIKK